MTVCGPLKVFGWFVKRNRGSGLWRFCGQLRRKPLLPLRPDVNDRMTFNLGFPSFKARQRFSVYRITTFDHISPSDDFSSRWTLVTVFGAIYKHYSQNISELFFLRVISGKSCFLRDISLTKHTIQRHTVDFIIIVYNYNAVIHFKIVQTTCRQCSRFSEAI